MFWHLVRAAGFAMFYETPTSFSQFSERVRIQRLGWRPRQRAVRACRERIGDGWVLDTRLRSLSCDTMMFCPAVGGTGGNRGTVEGFFTDLTELMADLSCIVLPVMALHSRFLDIQIFLLMWYALGSGQVVRCTAVFWPHAMP